MVLNKGKINLFTKQKQSHRCRRLTYGYQGEGDKLGDWDRHIRSIIYKTDS